MSVPPIMLGDAEISQVLGSWTISDTGTVQSLIIFGAIGLVILLIVIWAIFLRKQSRRRRSHHHFSETVHSPRTSAAEDVPPPPETHHKRKRRRRKHRSRNPTLAETGGLPPVRPELPP